MKRKKLKCVRCESMERPQKSHAVYVIKNALGEPIPLCAACIVEIRDEEDFFESLKEEEEDDEFGGESFNQ